MYCTFPQAQQQTHEPSAESEGLFCYSPEIIPDFLFSSAEIYCASMVGEEYLVCLPKTET